MKLYFTIAIFILMLLPVQSMAKTSFFSSAEKASEILYQAIEKKDKAVIENLFGTENIHLLPFDEVSDEDITQFLSAWFVWWPVHFAQFV